MAQVIDRVRSTVAAKVVFGATVELEDEDSGDMVKLPDRGRGTRPDLEHDLINIQPIAVR